MALKDQLQRELSQYDTLKTKLNNCNNYLSKANSEIINIKSTVDANYQINDDGSIISEKADGLSKKTAETSNYLKNSVIPAIDAKQNQIREQIRQIEREEEEEREREERARSSYNSYNTYRSYRW